jgi:hypothetical protein
MDKTRIATFMFGNSVSGRNFSFLDGVTSGFHQVSHHQNDKGKLEQYRLINRFHIQKLSYLIGKLKSIKEGQHNILYNSMILFGSGLRNGNAHDPINLPIVFAGNAGGKIKTGKHLVFPKNTPLCNLHLTMLNSIGCPQKSFGNSTGPLKI